MEFVGQAGRTEHQRYVRSERVIAPIKFCRDCSINNEVNRHEEFSEYRVVFDECLLVAIIRGSAGGENCRVGCQPDGG